MTHSVRRFDGIRHFIWDFDGTLFDTYPIIIADLQRALAEFGREAAPQEVMRYMLDSIPGACRHYAEEYSIPLPQLTEAYQQQHRLSTEKLEAAPMPGARAVLERIAADGRSSYIFTHRPLAETRLYLEKYGLLSFFCEIVGPESPGFARKPAPDALVHLMARHGIAPETAVMLGDREIDLGSGRSAGIACVHLVCAAAPQQLVCDWRLHTLEELSALL